MLKKIKSDKGATMSIIYIALFGMILFLAIFIVDYMKMYYIKSLMRRNAQTATQTAIKEQNRIGGLKPSAVEKVVEEYMKQRNGNGQIKQTREVSAFTRNCDVNNEYPKITVTLDSRRAVASKSMPYYSEHGAKPSIPDAGTFYAKKYVVVQTEIEDIVYRDFGSVFGNHCQLVKMVSSAITTGHFDAEN